MSHTFFGNDVKEVTQKQMFSDNWKTAPKINIKTYANDTVCIHSINSITNSYSWKHIFSVHTSVRA